MHAIKERPVVVNGQIVIRPIMVVALTYDHRLLDGREAVTFLGELSFLFMGCDAFTLFLLLFCFSRRLELTCLYATVKVRDYIEDPRKMLLAV